MITIYKLVGKKRRGIAMIMSMIFVAIFSALAVAMASMSGTNTEVASNQQQVNSALQAAQSGIECGKYYAASVPGLPSTTSNTVSSTEATTAWNTFCTYIQNQHPGGKTVPAATTFTDTHGSGYRLTVPAINLDSAAGSNFAIQFYKYTNDANIYLESTGADGQASRKITVRMGITKAADVLKYAVATRSRMWITGDSTIHGDIFSAWNLSTSQLAQLTNLKTQLDSKISSGTLNSTTFASLVSSLSLTTTQRTTILNQLLAGTLSTSAAAARCITTMSAVPSISPFNLTSDSQVLGTINTCWSTDQIDTRSWQLETLDAYGNPMYDQDGNKIISSNDEIQGECAGINYGVPPENMAGMSISDYDTTSYCSATQNISTPSATALTGSLDSLGTTNGTKYRYEYFPHAADSYTQDRPGGGGLYVKRYIYKNQTFTDAKVPASRNALFVNCTFNGTLFVECGSSTYNNVRFDNCTFNGTTVTSTPPTFNWQKNCLYYTGSATFQNNTSAEATILAPHFNVNLGNTNPVAGTDNVLRGAIVGGIVDIRGNAEVFGTIISMADTSSYTSGYVTNIGATLSDGGSETVSIGDIGTINITPDEDKLLPSGISSPIVIKPVQSTYSEG